MGPPSIVASASGPALDGTAPNTSLLGADPTSVRLQNDPPKSIRQCVSHCERPRTVAAELAVRAGLFRASSNAEFALTHTHADIHKRRVLVVARSSSQDVTRNCPSISSSRLSSGFFASSRLYTIAVVTIAGRRIHPARGKPFPGVCVCVCVRFVACKRAARAAAWRAPPQSRVRHDADCSHQASLACNLLSLQASAPVSALLLLPDPRHFWQSRRKPGLLRPMRGRVRCVRPGLVRARSRV